MSHRYPVRAITVSHRCGGCHSPWSQASEEKKAKDCGGGEEGGSPRRDGCAGCPLEDRAGPVGPAMEKETIRSRLDAEGFREHPIVRLPFQE